MASYNEFYNEPERTASDLSGQQYPSAENKTLESNFLNLFKISDESPLIITS